VKKVKCAINQSVRVVDMNDEIILEVLFEHGVYEALAPILGATVVNYPLGLQEFTVVYDKRQGKIARSKIIDLEINLLEEPSSVIKVFLEPIKLIVGQHDVGIV
jgi:hypothetical protein